MGGEGVKRFVDELKKARGKPYVTAQKGIKKEDKSKLSRLFASAQKK